jgi:hypothetical protein
MSPAIRPPDPDSDQACCQEDRIGDTKDAVEPGKPGWHGATPHPLPRRQPVATPLDQHQKQWASGRPQRQLRRPAESGSDGGSSNHEHPSGDEFARSQAQVLASKGVPSLSNHTSTLWAGDLATASWHQEIPAIRTAAPNSAHTHLADERKLRKALAGRAGPSVPRPTVQTTSRGASARMGQ